MTITSAFILNTPVTENVNGKKLIVEQHTDSVSGRVVVSYYVASESTTQAQIDQIMADRNADLTASLVDNDINEALYGSDPNFTWQNATNDDISDAARAGYRDVPVKDIKREKIARRILEWISIGRFTDLQIRNKFGLDATSWTTLKAKMQSLVDSQDIIDTTVGE